MVLLHEGLSLIIILSVLLVINIICLCELIERRRTILNRYRRAVLTTITSPV